jgi:hypothetical protein
LSRETPLPRNPSPPDGEDDDALGGLLDDVELQTSGGRGEEDEAFAPRPSHSEGRLFPVALAGVAVAGAAILLALFLALRGPATQAPGPPAAPPAGAVVASPAPPAAAPPLADLPALDDSDPWVRSLAAGLASHPELTRWLARAGLVRTLTVVVRNVADGETPRPHLGFLAPARGFRGVRGPGARLVPDPAGFAAYDRFADAVASIDATAAVAAFRVAEPLFDAAHRELGQPEGRFREALDRAIAALLAVSVLPDDTPLLAHATLHRWADPRLERLTPAQKQFLRIGPRNVRRVQGKLHELRSALDAAASPAL